MLTRSTVAAALLLAVPAALSAQTLGPAAENRPAVVLFANGGGYSPLTDLNESGTASLKTDWGLGGGAGVQLNRYVALRAVLDYGQTTGQDGSTAFASDKLRHYFYGGDVQLRYPTVSGFAPYVLLGAGAVTIDSDNPAFDSFTKPAGKAGLGIEYQFPQNGLGLFAQGASYVYNFDRSGFDRTQWDMLWTAGLSYRFGL
jgi:Outer membrane protein beta-barrel domain